jgi:N-acetylglucosaminyldiphosphoundecaprenol N-acetyl-beta-D-mannosaminyltransferase
MKAANVLGVRVDAVNIRLAADRIEQSLSKKERGYICVTGVHGIMEAQDDPELKSILNHSLLTVPDGMPAVWVGRLQGCRSIRRVFGPDLMNEICSRSVRKGYTHFLYGGAPGVAMDLEGCMRRKFPGIRLVGTYTPPFRRLTPTELRQIESTIRDLHPDIVWVGISTPKQERFMAEQWPQLASTLMIGVGAAFDFHTGRLRDAPNWVKVIGLQWLHRLMQEPGRLWKRYTVNNPRFLWRIFLQLTGIKS